MRYTMFWLLEHRGLLVAMVAASLWITATYWYWRRDIARMRRDNQPHSWSVNMAARTSKGGRKR